MATLPEQLMDEETCDMLQRMGWWFQQGFLRGYRQGFIRVLHRQLTLKFGELSRDVEERLTHAQNDEIIAWIERVLFGESLEELFSPDFQR